MQIRGELFGLGEHVWSNIANKNGLSVGMKPTLASRWIIRKLIAGVIIKRVASANKIKIHSGVKIDLRLAKQLNNLANTRLVSALFWKVSPVTFLCYRAFRDVFFAAMFARRVFAITQPSTNRVIGMAASPKYDKPPTTYLPNHVSDNACSGGVSANIRPIMLLHSGGEQIIFQALLLNFATVPNTLRWGRYHCCRIKWRWDANKGN